MYKVIFIFSKKGLMRYISHLDLMRLFMRALRRADLPIKITEGFNPHPKISIKRALKLGIESDNEEAAVVLRRFVKPQDFKQRLQEQLPPGLRIKEVSIYEMYNRVDPVPACRQAGDTGDTRLRIDV